MKWQLPDFFSSYRLVNTTRQQLATFLLVRFIQNGNLHTFIPLALEIC